MLTLIFSKDCNKIQTVKLYKISNFPTVKIILQNSFKTFKELHKFSHNILHWVKTDGSRYCQLTSSPIYILLCLFATLLESFTSTGCMHANGTFSCARRQRNCFGMKNSNSCTHSKNITHCSGPNQQLFNILYMYFVHKRCGIVCFVCHEWLRSDLKIRFSNSSNKHGTGKADEIFTEIWQDSFSPCENSAKIPLESHKIPEGGWRSLLMGREGWLLGSYIWVLWMKKDDYWTVEIKIELQHPQPCQNLAPFFWHGKKLTKTSSIRSHIFQKPFATGAPPQTRLRELNPLDPLLQIASQRWRLDPTRGGTLIAAPYEKKWKANEK